jgi:hypothetical protein
MPREKPIIPCELSSDVRELIKKYGEELIAAAPFIGSHGLSEEEFWASGLFRGVIEKLRGTQVASTSEKRCFMEAVLNFMRERGAISSWSFKGAGERHDYEVVLSDSRLCAIEAKGCLDGNNTNIFERPPNADEFIIWSLCQNPGSDPRHNAWSGIHTRLSAEIIAKRQRIDGLVIWDMACGTKSRHCPKLDSDRQSATRMLKYKVPPPCIYLFPRTIPDPRNNPSPMCWRLGEVKFLDALARVFRSKSGDVTEVKIEARMRESDVQRRTSYSKGGEQFLKSNWRSIQRAR